MCDITSIGIYKSKNPRFYSYIMHFYVGSHLVLKEKQEC